MNFISIMDPNISQLNPNISKLNRLNIYFDASLENNFNDVTLIFTPLNVTMLTHLTNTKNLLDKASFLKCYPNVSKSNPTLIKSMHIKSWESDAYMDPSFDLTYEEYLNLRPKIRNDYTYEQTTWNSFSTDFIFDELLEYDKSGSLIVPSMKDSFTRLAFETTL